MEKNTKDNFLVKQNVEKLLTECKPLVSSISRRYFLIGGEIDDLVQEGMIGLYKAIESFDPNKEATFKTFATLCINRQIQTAIRKATSEKNQVFLELFDDTTNIYDEPSNKENPETNVISAEKMKYINSEIKSKLSKMEIVVLQEYLKGLCYDEIAKKLNIQKKSVDNALNRIRKKLAHLLDDTRY